MNSQGFLIILVLLIVLVLLSTWTGRKQKPPTKLNLRAQDSQPVLLPEKKASAGRYGHLSKEILQVDMKPQLTRGGKNLNILFNYNGHTFDAYEVLGVPAGSALPTITAAYQQALIQADPTSHVFLETAYKTILDRRTI